MKKMSLSRCETENNVLLHELKRDLQLSGVIVRRLITLSEPI